MRGVGETAVAHGRRIGAEGAFDRFANDVRTRQFPGEKEWY
jgi:hypothetical protein